MTTTWSAPRLGKNSTIYRNTGSWGTPSLATLRNCKDVKVPQSYQEDDVTARITGGVEAMVTTLQKYGVSWQMFDDDGPDITAIRTAYYAQSVIEFFVFNGLATDAAAHGVRMTCQVKKFDIDQSNPKANTYDVEIGITWPDPTSSAGSASAVAGGSTWTVAS